MCSNRDNTWFPSTGPVDITCSTVSTSFQSRHDRTLIYHSNRDVDVQDAVEKRGILDGLLESDDVAVDSTA